MVMKWTRHRDNLGNAWYEGRVAGALEARVWHDPASRLNYKWLCRIRNHAPFSKRSAILCKKDADAIVSTFYNPLL